MAANVDIEKQFLRLIMFCHKISLPVVRTFFVSGVLGCPDYNNDICTFLEHHKHEIFHLVGDYKCCKCTNLPPLQTLKFRLGNDQLKKMYDVGLPQPGHFSKGSGGRVFQQCICCVSVRKDTNPKNYDISLLFAILYNCVPLSDNSVSWLDTIRKSRNRLCHLNDINDLSEIEIHTLWGNLERSVTMLAGEIPSHPYYKESIEQHVDTFKYTDYNREAITPILESMRSEINNNINKVIHNQMISHEEIRCLNNHVEQLSQNCKKDNQNMLNHVVESAKNYVDLHQDAVHQVSAQVAKCHTEEVEFIRDQNKTVIESSEKVSGALEHVIDKLNFLVDIAIDNTKFQHSQIDSILPNSRKSYERLTTQEEKNSEEQDKRRCKLHWRIETPGYLEHKKDEIVKAMKNAIEIVKIGTSHEIEDIHEGSITIDTLLPMSILQDKNAFHQSIRKFLEEMVTICGIDSNIPLVVRVQITLSDLDQGSVKYSTEGMKHTTMIDKTVQAVPTMLDKSTGFGELEIKEKSNSTKRPQDGILNVNDLQSTNPLSYIFESRVHELRYPVFEEQPTAVDIGTQYLPLPRASATNHMSSYGSGCRNSLFNIDGILNVNDLQSTNPLSYIFESRVHEMRYPVFEEQPTAVDIGTQYLPLPRASATNHMSSYGSGCRNSLFNIDGISNDGDIETQYLHLARSTSTETSNFFELELGRESSRSSGSFSRDCCSCKLLMQKLNCEATKQFWREIDNEGPNDHQSCHVKFFQKFLERLKDTFPTEEGLKSKSTINLLKLLLGIDQKDPIAGVKLSDLKRIIDLFGPIKNQDNRCALIFQLHLLIERSLKARDKSKRSKSSWFVGDMTEEKAETCLLATDCEDKTYLVRISCTDGEEGNFALSVRHEDHCHHLKIQGDPKKALSESPYNAHLKFAGREFSSLPDVIDYVTSKQEIEMDTADETGNCSTVLCLRVFSKSPLNGAMSGYEKTK